jgi:predicted DNA-binding transcriptional regulator AlpA
LESPLLSGRKEIAKYTKRGWKTIQKWIDKDSFPTSVMGNIWTFSKRLIDEWTEEQIKKR